MRRFRGVPLATTVLSTICFLLGGAGCAAKDVEVRVSDGNRTSIVPPPGARRLASALETLTASCSVDSSKWMGNNGKWEQVLNGPYVLADYAKRVRIEVLAGPVTAEAILLPLPSENLPDHVLVKSGPSIYAFTKYRPDRLAHVVCDEHVGLGDHRRYRWFCTNLVSSSSGSE